MLKITVLLRLPEAIFPFRWLKKLLLLHMMMAAIVLPAIVVTPVQAANIAGTTYTYDAEGKLVQATISDGSQSVQIYYGYDKAGNIVSVRAEQGQ